MAKSVPPWTEVSRSREDLSLACLNTGTGQAREETSPPVLSTARTKPCFDQLRYYLAPITDLVFLPS